MSRSARCSTRTYSWYGCAVVYDHAKGTGTLRDGSERVPLEKAQVGDAFAMRSPLAKSLSPIPKALLPERLRR